MLCPSNWLVFLAENCPEPKTNSFRRVIYIFNIYKVQKFRQNVLKDFAGKMHFFGEPNLELAVKYSPPEVFCCFFLLFCFFFFIQCIALRYAENIPQKHLHPSAYFRGQHLAKIKELCKKDIFALICVYRSSSTEVIVIFILFLSL